MSKSNHMDGRRVREYRDRLVALEEQKQACNEESKEILAAAEREGMDKEGLRIIVRKNMETTEKRGRREHTEAAVAEMEAALEALAFDEEAEAAHAARVRDELLAEQRDRICGETVPA